MPIVFFQIISIVTWPCQLTENLHQEGRGQVNTIVMEYFNSILFPKSETANKQHTYQSVNEQGTGNKTKFKNYLSLLNYFRVVRKTFEWKTSIMFKFMKYMRTFCYVSRTPESCLEFQENYVEEYNKIM